MNMNLINTRRNNQIFADDTYAYKIFREDYSKTDVFMEAFITSRIEDLGLNSPQIKEVMQIDGKWAIKFPFISGTSLYTLMQSHPDQADKYLHQLVEIQTGIHKKKCPLIPIQKEKLSDYINNSNIDKSLKIDLLDMLNSSPKHKKLCHGNFTPHNVLIASNGKAYVIDWNHASQGNASADVARTYIWMQLNLPNLADKYLEIFCETTNTSKHYVKNWIPIVAAARLAKNNPEELKLLKSMISVMEY